jgi:hypothetical protein
MRSGQPRTVLDYQVSGAHAILRRSGVFRPHRGSRDWQAPPMRTPPWSRIGSPGSSSVGSSADNDTGIRPRPVCYTGRHEVQVDAARSRTACGDWLGCHTRCSRFPYEEPDAIGAAQTTPEDAGSQSGENVGSEPEGALAARQRAEDSPVDDPCPSDCAAHAAGYAWAEERGISEPGECEGDSVAFVEGCRAYVEERLEQTLLGK